MPLPEAVAAGIEATVLKPASRHRLVELLRVSFSTVQRKARAQDCQYRRAHCPQPRVPSGDSTMTSAPTGDQRPDQRAVLVADLDGAPLTVLSVLEELLWDLAAWEESDAVDPPEIREALRLPAPLAGGVALAAVRRLAEALQSTQCPGPERGRLLGPDGSYEHTPLSVLILRSADIEILAATARALGRPGLEPDLVDVLTAYADRFVNQLAGRHTPADRAEVVPGIAGLGGLLDPAPPAAPQLLIARLVASPPGLDLALTDAEEAAYAATADRINTLWAAGSTPAGLRT